MNLIVGLRSWAAPLLNLVFPPSCVVCRAPGRSWCQTCRPAAEVLWSTVSGVPVVAAGTYGGAIRTALLGYKERRRRDLARPLARLLSCSIQALAPPDTAVLVPMPSRAEAVRVRGGDHARLLSRQAGRAVRLPTRSVLRVSGGVLDSAGLSAAERAANLSGLMTAHHPAGPGPAVLVDDIVTTGASLAEAARALRAAGWSVHGAAVIGHTPRRFPVGPVLERSGHVRTDSG